MYDSRSTALDCGAVENTFSVLLPTWTFFELTIDLFPRVVEFWWGYQTWRVGGRFLLHFASMFVMPSNHRRPLTSKHFCVVKSRLQSSRHIENFRPRSLRYQWKL